MTNKKAYIIKIDTLKTSLHQTELRLTIELGYGPNSSPPLRVV